jgi:hypothetical protein
VNRRYAEKRKPVPLNRVEPACLTFPSALVSSMEYECSSEVYRLHPYFRAESFKHLFYKKYGLISVYSQIKQTHWCFAFRYVPCNIYEYWKVGKSRIEISTMKLRIADIMTQEVWVNDSRFLTLKIYSAWCLFHNHYLPFNRQPSCFRVKCLSFKWSFVH